ncbi:MAG: hypothetical protein QCI82_01545 [Candidatus Thermoplasmatota archaeon]|nr:hypothetical protein [Candidatus Thermoplasmatota archaeon]
MKSVTCAMLKENVKCSSIGIARIFSVKALVMLVIVLSTVLPIIVISEDDQDPGGDNLYKYRHPSDATTNRRGEVVDWEGVDEIPENEGSDDAASGTALATIVLAISILNIAICHVYLFSKNIGKGRLTILQQLGVPDGQVFRGNVLSVAVLFSVLSVLDMVFLSIIYAMVSSLFLEVIVVGTISSTVVLSLYIVGITHPTSVKLFKRRFMVPLLNISIIIFLGILLSRTILDPVFEMVGLDIEIIKAILTGFSPVHFIGAVAGWMIGGEAIRVTDLLWTVPVAILICMGIVLTGRIKAGELRSPFMSLH